MEEYLVDLNATQAAIRAGYKPRGAKTQGSRVLTYVDVAAAIVKAKAERAKRMEISQDAVLRRVADLAFTDLDSFVAWEGGGDKITLRSSIDIPRDKMGALQEIAETKEGLRIKLVDRTGPLTLLFRHLGLLPTPGSRDDPFHHKVTMEEAGFDLSKLTDDQLQQILALVGGLGPPKQLTAGNPD